MSTPVIITLILGLLTLQLVIGLAIVRSRDVFSATMLTGAFSLLGACLFMVLDAADVAFTEAAVGAGVSTALALGALSLVRYRDRSARPQNSRMALVACTALFAFWMSVVLQMPAVGDPNSPLQKHPLTTTYFDGTATEIGIPNVVTAVLGSYRAFDTLGEAFVIFIAGMVVYLLLGRVRPRPLEQKIDSPNTRSMEDSDANR